MSLFYFNGLADKVKFNFVIFTLLFLLKLYVETIFDIIIDRKYKRMTWSLRANL